MRASKVIAALERRIEDLTEQNRELHDENRRLSRALLAASDKPAVAAFVRKRTDDEKPVTKYPRPIGL